MAHIHRSTGKEVRENGLGVASRASEETATTCASSMDDRHRHQCAERWLLKMEEHYLHSPAFLHASL